MRALSAPVRSSLACAVVVLAAACGGDTTDPELQHLPDASLIRLWKDTGLYRGDGSPRPARDTWRAALARPRR